MRDSLYANENGEQSARHHARDSLFRVGTVDNLPDDSNKVRVRYSASDHELATVHTPIAGDGWKPTVGTQVIISRRVSDSPTIIGIAPEEPADVDAGERVISHGGSDTKLRFNNDGCVTISIDGGGTLTLDSNGLHLNEEVITDIQTQSADGYLTSITPTKTDTLPL